MSDEAKTPPVAIRITRPFDSEETFLEHEFDTLTKTSVVLLGAQARPQGVVLRFEIVLKSGESVLRGEGRVVAFKERAHGNEPGLTLRFTRLDSKSKTLVDRASTLRDARVRGSASLMSMPAVVPPGLGKSSAPGPFDSPAPPSTISTLVGSPAPPSSLFASALPQSVATTARASSIPPAPPSRRTPPPLPEWARAPSMPAPAFSIPPDPPSSAAIEIEPDSESMAVDSSHMSISRRPPPLPVAVTALSAPRPPLPTTLDRDTPALAAPEQRDALLARLRTRARSLPSTRVDEILTKRA